jgi:hypothetical protein
MVTFCPRRALSSSSLRALGGFGCMMFVREGVQTLSRGDTIAHHAHYRYV